MLNGSHEFGMPMLQALGIDTKNVTGFTIVCNVEEIPTITVTSVLPSGFGVAAARVAQRFRIEALESVSLPAVDESTSLETVTCTTHRLPHLPGFDRT